MLVHFCNVLFGGRHGEVFVLALVLAVRWVGDKFEMQGGNPAM
jgi:hypothetical protein